MKFLNLALLMSIAATGSVWSYPQAIDYDYDGTGGDYEDDGDYDANAPPPEFLADSHHIIKKEGETVMLNCATVTDTPHVLIVKKLATEDNKEELLFVGDMKIFRVKRIELNNGQFVIKNIRRSDAGDYMCSYNTNPSDPPVELIHTLEVQYSPRVSSHSEDQHVEQGSSVSLECSGEGNPNPRIIWSKVDGRLPSGAHEEEGLSMTLQDVDRHVEGNYSCKADNGIGNPDVKSMFVYVEYKPEIVTEKAIVRTGEGDRVELVCIVYSRPVSSVIWQKDNAPLNNEPNIREHEGGHRHALVINQVSVDDFGEYKCIAENSKGFNTGLIHMTDVPKPPHITSDKNGGEEYNYVLTWETESYYPITEYQIKYKRERENESSEAWEDLGMFDGTEVDNEGLKHAMRHNITGLEAATDYHVEVKVKNQFQWSDPTIYEFSTRKVVPTTPPTIKTALPIMGKAQEVAVMQTTASGSSSTNFSVLLVLVSTLLIWA
ncbi:unnamed protein product [Meganyctiphanes norvegica]|uniref:Neurotrimin n=1 Tax=Meganyctiphanes norvegica TaxID=48144 RepID=A0AAV2RUV4_MEGNR